MSTDTLNGIRDLTDATARYMLMTAYIRSRLQLLAFAVAELITAELDETDAAEVYERLPTLFQPTEGATVDLLDRAVPVINSQIEPGFASRWFGAGPSLSKRAAEFVAHRNSRPAHGVLDSSTVSTWAPKLDELATDLDRLVSDAIVGSESGPSIRLGTGHFKISLFDGQTAPISVSKLLRRGAGWVLHFQPVDPNASPSSTKDISSACSLTTALSAPRSVFEAVQVHLPDGGEWRTTALLPKRQTETFTARTQELQELHEWFDDTESRACLVWGDGGVGKTTLVLEFLSKVLTGSVDTRWKPELIVFFSAKQTRWGPRGLEQIRIAPALADAVRTVALSVEDKLAKDWYDCSVDEAINRVSGMLSAVNIGKNKVLLVLDNTETLTRSVEEEPVYTQTLRRVISKIGRVILTSRRKDNVEARPLQLQGLNDEAGAELLRTLGEIHGAHSIRIAGDAALRKYAKKLHGWPLLLEVFVSFACHGQRSLEDCLNLVNAQAGQDLGEFLYEDAWARIKIESREILLIIAQLGGVVDGTALGWICAKIEMPVSVWTTDFNEARFGTIVSYGNREDVQLNTDAVEFLTKALGKEQKDRQLRIRAATNEIGRRIQEALRAQDSDVSDRVLGAFKTTAAKAAKLACNQGKYDEAEMWYEEATKVDHQNAALWDRFAYFCMKFRGNYPKALACSREAIRLSPRDADVYFTAGMIASKMHSLADAESYFEQAKSHGKQPHLVAIQRAMAVVGYARHRIIQAARTELQMLTDVADEYLKEARAHHERGYLAEKHQGECARVARSIRDVRAQISKR